MEDIIPFIIISIVVITIAILAKTVIDYKLFLKRFKITKITKPIFEDNIIFNKHKCDICRCIYDGESVCGMHETISSTVSIHHVGEPACSNSKRYQLYHLCPSCINKIETYIENLSKE